MCALVIVMLVSTSALADIRNDIVDIRAGRNPQRIEVLGWTSDDVAITRTTICAPTENPGTTCSIVLTKLTALTFEEKIVFENRVTCDLKDSTCGRKMIDDDLALSLIAIETAFFKDVELVRGREHPDPKHVLGADISVEAEIGEDPHTDSVTGARATVFARRGKQRHVIGSRSHIPEPSSARAKKEPSRAYISPTRTLALVTLRYDHRIDVLMFDIQHIRDLFR